MLKRKDREFRPVRGALQEAFVRLGLSGRLAQQRALTVWAEAVGPQIAGATRPLHVRDGVLVVATRSRTWAHELVFRKAAIMESVNRLLGKGVLKDIRFVGRGYQDAPEEAAKSSRPLPQPEEWRDVPLSEEDMQKIENLLASVPEGALRERFRGVLLHDFRFRRWQEQHGYRACRGCGLPVEGQGDVCPLCRPRSGRGRA